MASTTADATTAPMKYKLFSSSSTVEGTKRPCAFFFSSKGCRNGDGCKFAHTEQDTRDSANHDADTPFVLNKSVLPPLAKAGSVAEVIRLDVGSVVSSESDDGSYQGDGKTDTPPPHYGQNPSNSGSNEKTSFPFVDATVASRIGGRPDLATVRENNNTKNRKKQKRTGDALFAHPPKSSIPAAPPQEQSSLTTVPPQKKHKATAQERAESRAKVTTVHNAIDFRSLNLPLASYSLMADNNPNSVVAATTTATTVPIKNEIMKQDQHASTKVRMESKNASNGKQETPMKNFQALNLPVTHVSLLPEVEPNLDQEGGNLAPTNSKRSNSPPSRQDATSKVEDPLSTMATLDSRPALTPAEHKWFAAMEATRRHPRYANDYDFTRYIQQDEETGVGSKSTWIKARPYGDWCRQNPQVIAIDCEMCETTDPVSGKRDPRALCRVSVVDAETKEVLLDTLVKPLWPVSDYRSWVNGICEEHLENVKFTLRHAQAFFMALCSEATIILGHSVQNDLAAIRMEHICAVDSALLFPVKDAPNACPSLRDLAASVLKQVMPDKHDSVHDATTSLLCLEHYLEKDGKVDPIERPEMPSEGTKNQGRAADQLFVHRIPRGVCDAAHLQSMFVHHTDIQPVAVADIEFNNDMGRTFVRFRSPRHATLAFDTLSDKATTDSSGRLQKKVFLRNGSYIRVRKMMVEQQQQQKHIKIDNKSDTETQP